MKINFLVVLCFWVVEAQCQFDFNGNLEVLTENKVPVGWSYHDNHKEYNIAVDSLTRKQGKYSVRIESKAAVTGEAHLYRHIGQQFEGKSLMFIANIKTEDVRGRVTIHLSINGENREVIVSQDLGADGPGGTTDWKEYMLSVPYDVGGSSISTHVILNGQGKIWIDSLRLYIDNTPINKARVIPPTASRKDTEFRRGSKIDFIPTDERTLASLDVLCQLWGYLKYHHPAVARGRYNWDNELIRTLPLVIQATSQAEVSQVLEKWVGGLQAISPCTQELKIDGDRVLIASDYGTLFTNTILSADLKEKLRTWSRPCGDNHYYVNLHGPSPRFVHEESFNSIYPDAGLRYLALCRYWAAIQYFFPYRDLMSEAWVSALRQHMPEIIAAADVNKYTIAMTKLVAKTGDSHAFISSGVLDAIKGKYIFPVKARMLKRKMIVTGFYSDTLGLGKKIKPGDEIVAINGIKIKKLINTYSDRVPASNSAAGFRDMIRDYLLRSNDSGFVVKTKRSGKYKTIRQQGKLYSLTNWYSTDFSHNFYDSTLLVMPGNIGYVHGPSFKASELRDLVDRLGKTKGLIIDLRGYPSDELTYDSNGRTKSLVNYIKSGVSPFVRFTHGTLLKPGAFLLEPSTEIGSVEGEHYSGRVIVLVDEYTQSNSEFVVMALQSAANVTILGSQTAGADGNTTSIDLPGAITASFSGLGVYYPDGICAQRVGVKIDVYVKPDISSIRKGKDKQLDKAHAILRKVK
ncbi:S41 family peptidase [Arcticibacter pallidicorallinus]|nr:S41 family peptidase [Arcticibacter pallidicorallinus]